MKDVLFCWFSVSLYNAEMLIQFDFFFFPKGTVLEKNGLPLKNILGFRIS